MTEDNQKSIVTDNETNVDNKEEKLSPTKKKILVLKKKPVETVEASIENSIEKDQLVLPDFEEIKDSIKQETEVFEKERSNEEKPRNKIRRKNNETTVEKTENTTVNTEEKPQQATENTEVPKVYGPKETIELNFLKQKTTEELIEYMKGKVDNLCDLSRQEMIYAILKNFSSQILKI